MGNKVFRGNLKFKGTPVSGVGDDLITRDSTTKEMGTTTNALGTLSSGNIFVGNASNEPIGVAVTGDISMSNAGVTAIVSGVIVNADINASAAIALSKLAALTASRALVSDGSGVISVSATTSTELGFVSGVTSAIQTQINTKQATITGAASTIVSSNLTANRVATANSSGKIDVSTVTTTELGYVSGVTSSIQTQLDAKFVASVGSVALGDILYYNGSNWVNFPRGTNGQALYSTATTIQWDTPTINGIPIGGTTGQVLAKVSGVDFDADWSTLNVASITDLTASAAELNILNGATVTTTELNYVSGASSNLQTQIDGKLSTALPQNAIYVGNASNVAASVSPGSNGQVLQIVAGVPTWQTIAGTGSVTSIDVSGGTTGLTTSGGPVTTSGTITLAGTLIAANGGTGFASYAVGDILQANTTSTLAKLAAVATGNVLISGGVTTVSSWGKVGLTTHVSGTLPIGSGGTNITTYTTGDILYASASNTLSKLTAGTNGDVLTLSTGVPTWAAVTVYTASNGLTKTGSDFTLGGTLTTNTSINGAGNILRLGTSGDKLFRLDVFASDNINIDSDSAVSLIGDSGVIATSGSSFLQVDPANIQLVSAQDISISNGVSSIDFAYFGGSISVSSDNIITQSGISTSLNSSGDFNISSVTDTVINADDNVTIFGTDSVLLNSSSVINFTTNTVQRLSISTTGEWLLAGASGTSGQVITSAGAGAPPTWTTVSGAISGLTTNRIPYATSSTTIGDDSALTWDATNNAMTLGHNVIHSGASGNSLYIGNSVGNFTTTGGDNIVIGDFAGFDLTSGTNNVLIGDSVGANITSGIFNTAVGAQSLNTNIVGNYNVAIGPQALFATTGSDNIGIGRNTGDNISSGSTNVFIGTNIDAQSATTDGQLSIQNIIFGTGNTATGTTVSTGSVGVGIAVPVGRFHVRGVNNAIALTVDDDGGNKIIEAGESGGARVIGLHGVTPAARATTGLAASTFAANTSAIANDTATWDGYTIGQVVNALRLIGILT